MIGIYQPTIADIVIPSGEVWEEDFNATDSWTYDGFHKSYSSSAAILQILDYDKLGDFSNEYLTNGKLQMLKDQIGGQRSKLTIPPIEKSSNGWTATIDFQIGSANRDMKIADGFFIFL